jgi:histidinol-phosphate aminotransferase
VITGLPIRDDLRGYSPYGAPQFDAAVQLNTNENPYPPPPDMVADIALRVAEAAGSINRYPDREALALRCNLAEYLTQRVGSEVSVDQVWAANGSNEILQQLLQVFGGAGRRALTFAPSYAMHPLIATVTGTSVVRVVRPVDAPLTAAAAAAAVTTHQPDVVFLCSPSNPTGGIVGLEVVKAVYAASSGIVIVDEAYGEFADSSGYPSAVSALVGRERLVVTRTLSKAFAFAGARLGYLAADPAVVAALRLVRLPYHLSSLTQAAARVALSYAAVVLSSVDAVVDQRDRLVSALSDLGFPTVPSAANFVLFGGLDRHGGAPTVWRRLAEAGVLVRDVGLPGWLRVSVGTEPEMSTFLAALSSVTASGETV